MILVQPEPNEDAAFEAAAFEAEELEDAHLVEPFRTSSVVTKFSGTLGSSVATDKLTSTVLAFSHFVLENTACLLAFADLQGGCSICYHLCFFGLSNIVFRSYSIP